MRSRFLPFLLMAGLTLAPLPADAQQKPKKEAKKTEAPAKPAPPAIPTLSESLTGTAKTGYEAGRVLFQDGDYAGAALKFQKAYAASKDARLLWNVAAAEKNLRHYSKVITALEQYLAEGGDKLTDQDRADAKQLVETVAAFVGSLEMTVDQPDAEISIDGEPTGKSPLSGPVRLDHGAHVVSVKKQGFEDYSVRPTIGGGETQTLKVVLKAIVHQGRLRVLAAAGETISVDGKVVGKGTWEGALESGQHSVSVSGRGKRTKEVEVLVRDGEVTTSRVRLDTEAPPAPKKDEGFWATPWPWVIGGAVVASGAGVGAYFLFRPEDEKAPAPVGGTLNPGTVRLPMIPGDPRRGIRF